MKKILVVTLATFMLLNITGCKKEEQKNNGDQNSSIIDDSGEKKNNSEELNKEKTFGDYKVADISLITDKEQNVFMATIENISSNPTSEKLMYITFLDNNNSEIYKMAVFVKALQPKESIDIKGNISIDVINSYNFKLTDK